MNWTKRQDWTEIRAESSLIGLETGWNEHERNSTEWGTELDWMKSWTKLIRAET